jgi:hypothetical protein
VYFHEYVVNYTNAPTLIREEFKDTEDLDGLFSGFDAETGTYDNQSSWDYERGEYGKPRTDPPRRQSSAQEHYNDATERATAASTTEDGLLHSYQPVHWLQSLRGGL